MVAPENMPVIKFIWLCCPIEKCENFLNEAPFSIFLHRVLTVSENLSMYFFRKTWFHSEKFFSTAHQEISWRCLVNYAVGILHFWMSKHYWQSFQGFYTSLKLLFSEHFDSNDHHISSTFFFFLWDWHVVLELTPINMALIYCLNNRKSLGSPDLFCLNLIWWLSKFSVFLYNTN